ncbi:MAG TPA: hypothetical protein VNL77_06290 [Roseiflexaceae bacterium]|nr:hypothetical protein [Roseiflexaceae bacterium]
MHAVLDSARSAQHAALDLLASLVNKSLVVAKCPAAGEARYRLLEPLREYARSELARAGEERCLCERHLQYFLTLAETIDGALYAGPRAEWLARLEQEQENLRAALGWSLQQGGAEHGLRLAVVLGRFWQHRGHYTEGRRWLTAMLARQAEPSLLRAHALLRPAILARLQRDFAESRRLSEAMLALAALHGDQEVAALALENTGWTCADAGDAAGARAAFERSLACFETHLLIVGWLYAWARRWKRVPACRVRRDML